MRYHFFVMYFFRRASILKLILTKYAPKIPHRTPFMKQAGIVAIVDDVNSAAPMKLRVEAETCLTSPNIIRSWQAANVITDVAHAMNTFHVTVKVQNVVGFESSYVKRAPPTGEPKAAATPADAPAAIK